MGKHDDPLCTKMAATIVCQFILMAARLSYTVCGLESEDVLVGSSCAGDQVCL